MADRVSLRFACWFAAIAAGFGLTTSARAVVIGTSDSGSGNTTTPTASNNFTVAGHGTVDFTNFNYWGNICSVNGSTGIYVGNGYVLTAAHVGAGTITLTGGQSLTFTGTFITLPDPGNSNPSDVRLLQVAERPSLPSIIIASSAPGVGTPLLMSGNGWDRAVNPTYWNTATNPWTETTQALSNESGYKTQSASWGVTPSQHVRWGSNTVSGASTFDAPSNTKFFTSTFVNGGTPYEAQGVDKDSGGPTFELVGGQWQLIGLVDGVGTLSGQPNGTLSDSTYTVAYSDVTYFSDLSYYRTEINNNLPEPASLTLILTAGAVLALRRRGRPN